MADVRLPDGTIIRNVPEGTTQAELTTRVDSAVQQGSFPGALGSVTKFGEGLFRGLQQAETGIKQLGAASEGFGDVLFGREPEPEREQRQQMLKSEIALRDIKIGELGIPGQAGALIGETLPSFAVPGGPAGGLAKRIAGGVAADVVSTIADPVREDQTRLGNLATAATFSAGLRGIGTGVSAGLKRATSAPTSPDVTKPPTRTLTLAEEKATLGVPDQPIVGRPTLDKPVDFTPQVSSESIVANLRKGKTAKVADTVVPDVEIIESAQRLGVDLNPEHYSTNVAFQDVARALKTRPGSQLQANEVAALSALSEQADDLVVKNKGFLDRSEFSQEIGSEITTSIDNLSKQTTKAYATVNDAIPAATKVESRLVRDYLDTKLAELGGDTSLLTSVEKQLLALTRKTKKGEIIPPTYAAIDRVRKNVGNGFSRQGPFADVDQAILSEVYGVLSDVQNGVARSFGVGDLYDTARGLVVTRKGLEDTAVQLFGRNISGSLTPKLKGAATGLVKGDVTKFNQLIEALPQHRRSEAAATVLSEIFAGGSRSGGELGTGFVQSFNAFNRNKTAKNLLFSHLAPEVRQRFDDIGRIMTGIVESNRKPLGNPSGSAGPIVKALDDLSFVEKAYEGGKKIAAAEGVSSAIGVPGIGTAAVVGSLISKQRTPVIVAADQMLSSPEFTRAIGRAVQGDVVTANKIIENSSSFKKWLATTTPEVQQRIAVRGIIAWLSSEEQE